MQQALRRPLRLTQKHDVHAYYLVNRNTMESAAVSLIMEKMAAAIKVNGDSLEASLMASQANADDVLSQLGKVLQGTAQVKDLRAFFIEKELEANARRAREAERAHAASSSQPAPRADDEELLATPSTLPTLATFGGTLKPVDAASAYQSTLF